MKKYKKEIRIKSCRYVTLLQESVILFKLPSKIIIYMYRFVGGKGVGGEWGGGHSDIGGGGPGRRQNPEGGVWRGVGRARGGLDSWSGWKRGQPGLGTVP